MESTKVEVTNLMKQENKYQIDFSEVKGQENVKRALEIAAAGRTQSFNVGKSADQEKQ